MKKLNLKLKNKSKGITLIALVITIIVLLILAGVTIATLTGENGILKRAKEAKTETKEAEEKEKINLSYNSYIIEKTENKKPVLYVDNTEILELLNGWEIQFKDTKNIYYLNKENGTIGELKVPMLNENEWKGEQSLDSEYYGNIVYGLSTNLIGNWRLFYKNSSYVYIILDEPIGSYNPSNYYENYKNGSYISKTGKNLNSMVSSLFTEHNEDENLKATAWLTDVTNKLWCDYANNSGVNGAVAIGSPTIELMAASYNATQSNNTILLTVGEQGYNENTGNNWLTPELCNGIYSYSTDCMYWISSPFFQSNCGSWLVRGDRGYFDRNYWNSSIPIRPVVCLPIANLPAEFGYYH